jgi:tetratricopeptide (TPR) repeat protein
VEAEEALRLNPSNALILAEFGSYFGYLGEFRRSMALTKKAVRLNPHHPGWYYATVFRYHYHRREYPEALVATPEVGSAGLTGTRCIWRRPTRTWDGWRRRAAVARVLALYQTSRATR